MIVEACFLMGYVGGFCLLLALSELIVIVVEFIIYKFNKGKRNFWQYMKRFND